VQKPFKAPKIVPLYQRERGKNERLHCLLQTGVLVKLSQEESAALDLLNKDLVDCPITLEDVQDMNTNYRDRHKGERTKQGRKRPHSEATRQVSEAYTEDTPLLFSDNPPPRTGQAVPYSAAKPFIPKSKPPTLSSITAVEEAEPRGRAQAERNVKTFIRATVTTKSTMPVEQGADAIRAFIQAKMVERGVGIDAWLDTLEEARTGSFTSDGRKDHRTRMNAVQMEMGMAGVDSSGKSGKTEQGGAVSVNLNLSGEGGALTEEFAKLSAKEQVQNIIARSKAILAGAKTETEVARFVSENPLPEVTDEYIESRREAEGILDTYKPVLSFAPADIEVAEDSD